MLFRPMKHRGSGTGGGGGGGMERRLTGVKEIVGGRRGGRRCGRGRRWALGPEGRKMRLLEESLAACAFERRRVE